MKALPNILYIHTHDAGRYIEPYGYAVPTPHLMALARESLLFRNMHCAAPTCSPSRVAMLSGQAPHSAHCFGLTHRGWGLEDPTQHLAHFLQSHGYETANSGIQHEHKSTQAIGYRHKLHGKGSELSIEEAAAEFIERKHEKPFFLAVGWGDTHRSFPDPLPEDDERYCRPPEPLPDNATTRRDMAAYKRAAWNVDHKMGVVLQALERADLRENTIVIATTDHGVPFPHMKCHCTDHGTGVFFMMRYPPSIPSGEVTDALTSQIDLFPTLCDLLELPHPDWLQGTSIVPLFQNPSSEINPAVFFEVTYHGAFEPLRSIRTQRWRYIRRYDSRLSPVGTNCDFSPSKSFLVEQDWAEHRYDEEELYDCCLDPQQRNNLAYDPKYSDMRETLRGQLAQWMESTRDVLCNGIDAVPPQEALEDPDDFEKRVGG